MSSLDSGMDFASPFAPLTHRIQGIMPNSMGMGGQPGTIADTGGGPYMAGHQQARARVRGSKTPGAGPMGGGSGPVDDHVAMMAMMSAADLSDDEKSQVKDLKTSQQLKDYLAVRNQAMTQQRQVKPKVDLGFGQSTQDAQPSIGGTTPAGVAPGEMQISQGRGNRPDRPGLGPMSASDLNQWMNRVGQNLGAGEAVKGNIVGGGEISQRQGTNTYQELPGTTQFNVTGMTPPQTAQPQQPDLAATLKGHGIDPAYVQQLTNNGMTLQQAIQTAAGEARQQQTATHQQETEKRNDQRDVQRENRQYTHEEITDLHSQLREAAKDGNTAEVQRIQTELNQKINGMKPQQQATTPHQGPAVQPAGQNGPLDHDTAMKFYQQAGGDPNKARQIAQAAGYQF